MGESESLSLPSAEVLDRDDPIAHVRQEFEIPSGVIYLDGNSLGALPRSVAQRVHRV
ncbi:MAG: kynureninase, partial [Candidatus Limnocylindrus sp.]